MNTNEMEIVCTCNARAEVKAKGSVARLPKVKKAIIGRADINSYGKGGDRGKMVGGKYQILVILAEDFEGIKAGTPTTANAVLYKMGVKTMPFFTDFEKAKAACKKVAKWGKEPEKVARTSKSKELEEANKRIAELEAQLKLKVAAA